MEAGKAWKGWFGPRTWIVLARLQPVVGRTWGKSISRSSPISRPAKLAFGEFTRLGSQIEMSKTPEYWADPIIHPIGSSKPEWLQR